MTKYFPNLVKEKIHKQDKPKTPTSMHIVIKMEKVKDKENHKSSKGKTVNQKGASVRLSADLSTKISQARTVGTKYSK